MSTDQGPSAVQWARSDPPWVSSFEIERRVMAEAREGSPVARTLGDSTLGAGVFLFAATIPPLFAVVVLWTAPALGAVTEPTLIPFPDRFIVLRPGFGGDDAARLSGGALLLSLLVLGWELWAWVRLGRDRRRAPWVTSLFVAGCALIAAMLMPRVSDLSWAAPTAWGICVIGAAVAITTAVSAKAPGRRPSTSLAVDPSTLSEQERDRLLQLRGEVLSILHSRGHITHQGVAAAQDYPIGYFHEYQLSRVDAPRPGPSEDEPRS